MHNRILGVILWRRRQESFETLGHFLPIDAAGLQTESRFTTLSRLQTLYNTFCMDDCGKI
jgi:hypothetical protein